MTEPTLARCWVSRCRSSSSAQPLRRDLPPPRKGPVTPLNGLPNPTRATSYPLTSTATPSYMGARTLLRASVDPLGSFVRAHCIGASAASHPPHHPAVSPVAPSHVFRERAQVGAAGCAGSAEKIQPPCVRDVRRARRRFHPRAGRMCLFMGKREAPAGLPAPHRITAPYFIAGFSTMSFLNDDTAPRSSSFSVWPTLKWSSEATRSATAESHCASVTPMPACAVFMSRPT